MLKRAPLVINAYIHNRVSVFSFFSEKYNF